MGSIRAWLPSRRSTAHQRGALVMTLSGQVRSGSSTLIRSWNGVYRWAGIPEGFCAFRITWGLFWRSSLKGWPGNTNSAARGGLALDRVWGLAAAAKEKELCTHILSLARVRKMKGHY